MFVGDHGPEVDVFVGNFFLEVKREHDHAGDPEFQDVDVGAHEVCWEPGFEF